MSGLDPICREYLREVTGRTKRVVPPPNVQERLLEELRFRPRVDDETLSELAAKLRKRPRRRPTARA